MVKNYELTFLISPDLTEEEASKVQKTLASFIQEKEGTLINENSPVMRNLGYAVKDKLQAYIADLEFSLNQSFITEINKKVKENESVIRYILFKKEKVSDKKQKRRQPKEEPQKTEKKAPQKTSLGDIDKKIDEILND